jgi:ABC-2 type transport system ATP-binding protein
MDRAQVGTTGRQALPDRERLPSTLGTGPEPIVSFDGIWRYWGRGKKRWAVLRDIDLQLAPATLTCIAGANGAGKTTLLRIATGILAPHAGSVTVAGIRGSENWREFHRRIGFLSAGDRGLYARVSVRGHLEYVTRIAFMAGAEREQAVGDALERFGLIQLTKRRADRLSLGQRQRLRLALATIHRPTALFLDEPRNSLDGEGLQMLRRAIDEVLARGGAVVWCCPASQDEPIQFDRSFVIEDGTLRQELI